MPDASQPNPPDPRPNPGAASQPPAPLSEPAIISPLPSKSPKAVLIPTLLASALLLALWAFPSVWYSRAPSSEFIWFMDHTNGAPGWLFSPVPVSKAEEAVLTADVTFAGVFQQKFDSVQVFSAKRFSDRPNEIGLFVHTPDRCWTESGWKLAPADPDFVTLKLHGATISLERRIFVWSNGRRSLVYFGGLNGGQPLAYRLDHNLSVGQKQQVSPDSELAGARARALNSKVWGHAWDIFKSRQKVAGPKQFFRISSEIAGSNVKAAEDRILQVLPLWLQPGDFHADFTDFQSRPPQDPAAAEPAQHAANHAQVP